MIREQKNPLEMTLEELDEYLNNKSNDLVEDAEKYSTYPNLFSAQSSTFHMPVMHAVVDSDFDFALYFRPEAHFEAQFPLHARDLMYTTVQ